MVAEAQTYIDRHKERVQQQRQAEAAEVERAIAAEVNLLLRGRPFNQRVAGYASGRLADLRDVMLPAATDQRRWSAALNWVTAANSPEEQSERAKIYQLVMDARDPEREAVNLARAERDKARAAGFFEQVGTPALALNVIEGEGSASEVLPPKRNPKTFITTFTAATHQDGTRQEWTSICPMTKNWRTDQEAYKKRVDRVLAQLQEEGIEGLFVEEMETAEWEKLCGRWKKRNQRGGNVARYVKLPQEDGRQVVIHDSEIDAGEAARPLEQDIGNLRLKLRRWMQTPEDKRIAYSPGFGGDYQGTRGDGRRTRAKREGATVQVVGQLITEGQKGIVGAANLLGIELNKKISGRRELPHGDAVLALLENGYTLKPRHVHQGGLQAVLERYMLAEDEPDNAEEMSLVMNNKQETTFVHYTGQSLFSNVLTLPTGRNGPAPGLVVLPQEAVLCPI